MAKEKLPEKITDFSVCLNLSMRDRRYFPKTPAIYFAYIPPDDVRYIGRTKCLRGRWSAIRAKHWLVFNSDVRLAWFPLPTMFHWKLEEALIDLYKPRHNLDTFLVR